MYDLDLAQFDKIAVTLDKFKIGVEGASGVWVDAGTDLVRGYHGMLCNVVAVVVIISQRLKFLVESSVYTVHIMFRALKPGRSRAAKDMFEDAKVILYRLWALWAGGWGLGLAPSVSFWPASFNRLIWRFPKLEGRQSGSKWIV